MNTYTATASDGTAHVRRSSTKVYTFALLQAAPNDSTFTRAFFYSSKPSAAATSRPPAGWRSELVEVVAS